MSELELGLPKASPASLRPSPGPPTPEDAEASGMMRGEGPVLATCSPDIQPPPPLLLKSERSEPMEAHDHPQRPPGEPTYHEAEDSCPSEEENEGDEGTPLQGLLNDARLHYEGHGHGQESRSAERPCPPMPLSDVDEEEELEDDQRPTAFDMQRKRLDLQRSIREPFGNLTVTKFPINGHQHQHPHHFLPRQGGVYTDTFNTPLLKQSARSRRLLEEQQFHFLSSTPQTSPNQNDPFHNNNNNNALTLNNNKEGVGKGHPHPHPLKQEAPERPTQRRNHHGHFLSHLHQHQHQQQQQAPFPAQGQEPTYGHPHPQAKGDTKIPNNSPIPTDLKPDCLGVGGGGLNALSRTIGTALLNLASLGSLAAFQQPQQAAGPNTTAATPLNLTSNGGGLTATSLANSYLAHYMSAHHNQSTNQRSPSPSATFSAPNSLPQLILASGNIVQGIQGAQLLIPSAQGLMTQTVLTIPITQPLSPTALLSSPNAHSPPDRKTHPAHAHAHAHPHPHRKAASASPSTGRPSTTRTPSPSPDFPLPHHTPQSHSHQASQGHIPLISEKLAGLERGLHPLSHSSGAGGSLNGYRMSPAQGRRESSSGGSALISASLNTNQGSSSHFGAPHPLHPHGPISHPPKHPLSPCSSQSHDHDDSCDFFDPSDNDDDDTMMDGINLDEIKEFAKAFKLRRLSLGLTQTQVGQALSVTEGPAYSQSAICRALAWQLTQSQSDATIPQHPAIFEKLDITPKSAQKIKPVLEKWMKEAEDRYRTGNQNLNEFVGMEPSKKRKRRTSFTPQALEILNTHFERNTHPSGAEITTLAHQLGYEREVIRIWFCNKRQALKNTVRMMSKGASPI